MTATDLDLDALLDALTARALERAAAVELVNVAGQPVGPGLRASTGRLQVNPGDIIASVWGNTTYDQTVQAYDTTAARDSQWPTPKDGAMAYTVDTTTLWVRRAGAWAPIGSPGLPPVTSGGLVSAVDASGEVWVAKPGVNAGAWKKARDVLSARWYRAAAYTLPTGVSGFPLDTASFDAYGLYTVGTSTFTAPVAGLYQTRVQVQANATAAGQSTTARIQSGATVVGYGGGQSAAALGVTSLAVAETPLAAGGQLTVQGYGTALALNTSMPGYNWADFVYAGTG